MPTFLPGYKAGGPIKSMVNLLNALPDSITLMLVTSDRDLGDAEPYEGVSGRLVKRGKHDVCYLNWRSARQWWYLLRWAKGNRVDLIYLNSLWSPQFTVLPVLLHCLGLLPARKVLLAPRGELSSGALELDSLKKRAFLCLWAPLLRRVDPIWHASTVLERSDIYRLFPEAQVTIQADGRDDDVRTEIVGVSPRAKFVYISRITKMKNLDLALRALGAVAAQVTFDIYGPIEDVKYWQVCQALIAELPKNVEAKYLGALGPDRVKETFAEYDAFLLPSRGENFGHVIAESLSSGCPVICSRYTPWTSVLLAGGGAVLDDLDASLLSRKIEAWASGSRSEREGAKRNALAAYVAWQVPQEQASAVEAVLGPLALEDRLRVSNSPRIALVTQGYQSLGGVQTVAKWLVTGLRVAGLEVQVFDLATSRTDEQSRRLLCPRTWLRSQLLVADASDDQVTHVGANAVEIEPMRYFPRAELSAELDRYDLIQVVAGGPSLALVAMKCSPPLVLQVATTVAWERASLLAGACGAVVLWRRAMTRFTSWMERKAVRRVDVVMVENREMQTFLRSVGGTRVVLAPPGIDTESFSPATAGWNASGYLLSVCRLTDVRKGLKRLIRAYAIMVNGGTAVPQLVLAGRGELPSHLWRLIAELDLTTSVQVRSDVSASELPSLYRGASVYLQASFEEGLGISVIEAMASGLPVVCTDTAGTRETVVNGVTGWLVPQGLDVETQMAARALSVLKHVGREMSGSARSRADLLFSKEATLSSFLNIYEDLIASADIPNRPT
jgi:glycosyltransferase involved in cell wall biosynthesis